MIPTYYNEWDKGAAMWLRQLMMNGDLRTGTIDERSVTKVQSKEVKHYERCHWFAGIGGWEEALALVRWPESLPVWTASLPCQPFSIGGYELGHEDERHLWPTFHRLVKECHPPVLVGEQTASKAGRAWLSAVRDDLEALEYAVGAADIGAAGAGHSHIRQRLYWVAISDELRSQGSWVLERVQEVEDAVAESAGVGPAGRVADARRPRREGWLRRGPYEEWEVQHGCAGCYSPDRGFSDRLVFVPCLDGRYRPLPETGPAEPGDVEVVDVLSPLVVPGSGVGLPVSEIDTLYTAEARVMRLKGYGNSISPVVAAHFLESILEVLYA